MRHVHTARVVALVGVLVTAASIVFALLRS
jgi:hypothetical protein